MKKIILTFLFLFFAFPVFAKINVVSTITDFASIAKEIGGDKIFVKSIATGFQDPHYLEPKPGYILLVNKADLLIEAGLGLEAGWLPVLITQSRNPKIQNGKPGRLNASEKIQVLEVLHTSVDRSLGDVHPDGNPHYWLNPENGIIIAGQIANRLSIIDPLNKSYYQSQLQSFKLKLGSKINQWKKIQFKGKKVLAYHKLFSYLADWLGLDVVDYLEPKPGIPPSASHIYSLTQKIKAQNVSAILTTSFYNNKPAYELSKKTNIKVIKLPSSVGGDKLANTYEELFDVIIDTLKESL